MTHRGLSEIPAPLHINRVQGDRETTMTDPFKARVFAHPGQKGVAV